MSSVWPAEYNCGVVSGTPAPVVCYSGEHKVETGKTDIHGN